MQVWEVMRELAKAPAGAEVVCCHNDNSYPVPLSIVAIGDELVEIVGSGKSVVSEDDEKPKRK
jgi:hypothetical protein